MVLILGDRYEIFAAAISSTILNIPIAHLHGGELTFGAIDDAFRHCITKISNIHFASNSEYSKRIVQMGEDPKNVFNVGALGVENIMKLKRLNKRELEQKLKFKFLKKNLMITFHPETLSETSNKKQIKELLEALFEFKNTLMIFTMPNADNDSRIIIKSIEEFVSKSSNSVYFKNLGTVNYLSCLKYVDGVVGNSSSGIIEVPSFRVGTVNIGNRQTGRIKPESIIDCEANKKQIIEAINTISAHDLKFLVKVHPMTQFPFAETHNMRRTNTQLADFDSLRAVIYAASTVGLEALLAGLPTLRFMPAASVAIDILSPPAYALRVTAKTLESEVRKAAPGVLLSKQKFFSPINYPVHFGSLVSQDSGRGKKSLPAIHQEWE